MNRTGRDHAVRTHRTLREMPSHLGEFADEDPIPLGLLYWLAGAMLLGLGLTMLWIFLDGVGA